MTKAQWLQPLSKAVLKLSPKADLAHFRNEYSEIVRSIKDDAKTKCRDLLDEARPLVEGWATEEDKCPCCAVREWSRFYEKAGEDLPLEALVAFAKRLPQMKPGAADWQPFFLSCRQKAVLSAIYERRFVGKATLQSWLVDKLQSVYSLPILDLAIENDAVPDYRALFTGCLKWGDRPGGLYSRYEVLSLCYSREPTAALDKDLRSFLLENSAARKPFFKAAFSLPQLYLRLADFLAATSLASDGPEIDGLMTEFVATCTDHAQSAKQDLPQIALALASLRLVLSLKGGSRAKVGTKVKTVEDASMQLASTALTHVEEDLSSQLGLCLSTLSAVQLHDLVHSHLKSLTSATSSNSGPMDRSSRYERHLGQKEVLEKVLAAIQESADYESLLDALEVALFNLGVRPLGMAGERTKFESRLHQGQESGIAPGDIVEVVDTGRCLGKGEELLVLVKAKVRRLSG